MGRARILKKPRLVPVNVESDIYDEIMSRLPREVSFADKVREWMLKELESLNMEKNEQGKSDPLNLKPSNNYEVSEEERSLDLFKVSENDVTQFMFKIIKEKDYETLEIINPKATIIHDKAIVAYRIKNQITEEKIREAKAMRINDPKQYNAYFNTVFDDGE